MIPKIIHQTARSQDISWEERRLVKKIKHILSDWQYVFHDDEDNEKLIAKYFPHYLKSYNSIPKGVAKADIARLVYMYVYGGFYFDTDYKLFRAIPDWMLDKEQLLMESREKQEEYKLGNAILASAPGGKFYKDFIEHIFESVELSHLKENRVELVTGPEALTAFYLKNKEMYEDVTIVPRTYFNPPIKFYGLLVDTSKDSLGAHLCWGSWRSGIIIKCIYVFLQRKIQAIF